MHIVIESAFEHPSSRSNEPPRWVLYRTLADPLRLRLLALIHREEFTLGELTQLVDEPQPTVSRHISQLRSRGLIKIRKEGTRAFATLVKPLAADPVLKDALLNGARLCEGDGSFDRIGPLLAQREDAAREFFRTFQGRPHVETLSPIMELHLAALRPLMGRTQLAIDVGTGDGARLELLAPLFTRVIGVDREPTRLLGVEKRMRTLGHAHVELCCAEYTDEGLRAAIFGHGGADVVFATRVLHHAARPASAMGALADMARSGGRVVVVDYQPHQDESLRGEADVWLGFEAPELRRLAETAGLKNIDVLPLATPRGFKGADAHLKWQMLSGTKE
ncbi:MAG: metalloregulator ArsR/SmtB family transcription factor [Myxococcales bacterium]|nr:metalloregulator ArsR/SmtB family transcription factor [Myxococcales bacterium]